MPQLVCEDVPHEVGNGHASLRLPDPDMVKEDRDLTAHIGKRIGATQHFGREALAGLIHDPGHDNAREGNRHGSWSCIFPVRLGRNAADTAPDGTIYFVGAIEMRAEPGKAVESGGRIGGRPYQLALLAYRPGKAGI